MTSPIGSLRARFEQLQVARGDALTFVMLAAVVIFLLVSEAVTGVLLGLYFRPTMADANASVRFIVTEVEFGALVRALHIACAHLLILVLVVTITWALVRRAYKSPHGLVWSCGIALLLVQLTEAFTGGLLPWTPKSVVDAEISTAMIGGLPAIGAGSRAIMLGANRAGDLALVRILGVHAGALPMLATAIVALLVLHFFGSALKQRAAPSESALPLVPDVSLRIAAACASIAIALLVSVSLWSPGLGAAAGTAAVTHLSIQPSWFLLFAHRTLRAAPAMILGVPGARAIAVVFGFVAALAVIFPTLDRKGSRYGAALGLIVMGTLVEETLRALLS